MLLEHEFPQDERVEKEIQSLLDEGHELRIATYTFKNAPKKEDYKGYVIYRKSIGRLMYKFSAAILVFPFYFAFWRSFVRMIYAQWNFEAIHIHDLPLARLGSEMQRDKGICFVADQHEYYSNWIVKTAHYNTLPGKVISLLSNWKAYEIKHLNRADLVCTVEEPLRQVYIRDRKLDPDRIIVIPNTPLSSIYLGKESKPDPGHFTLYYHGGLDRLRGIDVALKALPLLKDEIPGLRLVLVGKVNKHNDLIKQAEVLGVQDLVQLKGWIDYRDLPREIDQADLCFFTPPANRDELNNTIATKIYQYMGRSKPMLVGSARYMKQFVEDLGIGLAIDESDPADFARAVMQIYRDKVLREEMQAKAREKRSSYFWEHTVRPMLDFYARASSEG